MKEILFVAPTDTIYKNAIEVAENHGLDNIEVVEGTLLTGLEKALSYCAGGGCRVIISRGGTYKLIKSKIDIPIVEVKVGASDYIAAYSRLKNHEGRVAVIGYSNVVNFKMLGSIVKGNFYYRTVSSMDEVPEVIKVLREKGITDILGDALIRDIANTLNCNGILIESQHESVLVAMQQAEGILKAQQAERQRGETYIKAAMESISDAAILTGADGSIRLKNTSADRILKSYGTVNGTESIYDILPGNCLSHADTVEGKYMVAGRRCAVKSTPIFDSSRCTGYMILIRNPGKTAFAERDKENDKDNDRSAAGYTFSDIIHESGVMSSVINKAKKFALTDLPVLIYGGPGAGKELMAQSIHNHSSRKNGLFVKINCAALSLETEDERSSVWETPEAKFREPGCGAGLKDAFALASNGTLFLDNISDLPYEMQGSLLDMLQKNKTSNMDVNGRDETRVRLICSSSRDINAMAGEGSFRADLHHMINVLRLSIPSLNERVEDIIPLARWFLKKHASGHGMREPVLKKKDIARLSQKIYSGNVRELENLMEESVTLGSFDNLYYQDQKEQGREKDMPYYRTDRSLEDNDREYIRYVYEKTGCSAGKTAKLLGVSRTTLWRRLKNE